MGGRILVKIFHAVLVDEKIGLGVACDSDDVFIVVLDPASDLLAIDQFDDDGSPAFRKAVNILSFPESLFRRGLPPVSAADVLVWCSDCHVPKYSVFDVKIQE